MDSRKARWLGSCLLLLAAACGGDDGPGQPGGGGNGTDPDLPAPLSAVLGDYDITGTVQIVGTGKTVLLEKTTAATLTLAASQPGVMAVPEGMVIPGLAPEDIIFGAAYVQNPIHVFIGSPTADQHGDFGIWSSVWIGLPPDPVQLEYTGCENQGQGVFRCLPIFFQATEVDDQVNLIYFAVEAAEQANGDILVSGFLADTHRSEAAAANQFSVLADHDILGRDVYPFIFAEGATFSLTISGGAVSGSVTGTGSSILDSDPGEATFQLIFGGRKSSRGPARPADGQPARTGATDRMGAR